LKILFLDESGDHSLEKIDPQYPVFVLGGIIVDEEYANSELSEQLRKFKVDLFGRDDIILHTADIARNKNGFEKLVDSAFRNEFYARMNELMRDLDFKVVACAIRKEKHLGRYGIAALDPYMLSLNVLVERFCFEIGDAADGGYIVAEKRNPTLDNELELSWLNLKISGTQFLRAVSIKQRISQLVLRDKKLNLAGLQLADLVVSPIGRYVLGKPIKEDWQIVESKFRRHPQTRDYLGSGLIILPKE
jgi:hypothetical protein